LAQRNARTTGGSSLQYVKGDRGRYDTMASAVAWAFSGVWGQIPSGVQSPWSGRRSSPETETFGFWTFSGSRKFPNFLTLETQRCQIFCVIFAKNHG